MLRWIRKHYNLSPASPDFLNLTDEQIELEWELYKLEDPDKFKDEHYYDPSYEEWEKTTQEEDQRIILDFPNKEVDTSPGDKGDEWVEVPIDN